MSKTLIKEGVVPEKETYEFTCRNCGCVWTDDELNGTRLTGYSTSCCMTCGLPTTSTSPCMATVPYQFN